MKHRQLPDTPSNPFDYKQSSISAIHHYLATNSPASRDNDLVFSYLRDEIPWDSFISNITMEKLSQPKTPRVCKGPFTITRRENRNTRKDKQYQLTQKAFEQNRKAMVSKIPSGTFIMDNEGLEFPDMWEVEDLCVSRLEEGNNKDDLSPKLDETLHSELYGSISPEEVKLCISEIERDASPGPDSTLADLKILTFHKIAAVLNK